MTEAETAELGVLLTEVGVHEDRRLWRRVEAYIQLVELLGARCCERSSPRRRRWVLKRLRHATGPDTAVR